MTTFIKNIFTIFRIYSPYIPVINTVASLKSVFEKYLYKQHATFQNETSFRSFFHYEYKRAYLKELSITKCLLVGLPIIGNFYAFYKDFIRPPINWYDQVQLRHFLIPINFTNQTPEENFKIAAQIPSYLLFNKNFVNSAIQANYSFLACLPSWIIDHKSFIDKQALVKSISHSDPNLYSALPSSLKDDPLIQKAFIEHMPQLLLMEDIDKVVKPFIDNYLKDLYSNWNGSYQANKLMESILKSPYIQENRELLYSTFRIRVLGGEIDRIPPCIKTDATLMQILLEKNFPFIWGVTPNEKIRNCLQSLDRQIIHRALKNVPLTETIIRQIPEFLNTDLQLQQILFEKDPHMFWVIADDGAKKNIGKFYLLNLDQLYEAPQQIRDILFIQTDANEPLITVEALLQNISATCCLKLYEALPLRFQKNIDIIQTFYHKDPGFFTKNRSMQKHLLDHCQSSSNLNLEYLDLKWIKQFFLGAQEIWEEIYLQNKDSFFENYAQNFFGSDGLTEDLIYRFFYKIKKIEFLKTLPENFKKPILIMMRYPSTIIEIYKENPGDFFKTLKEMDRDLYHHYISRLENIKYLCESDIHAEAYFYAEAPVKKQLSHHFKIMEKVYLKDPSYLKQASEDVQNEIRKKYQLVSEENIAVT